MAPDLTICCTSAEAESDDRASVYAEDLTTRMTPNSSYSCTPRSSYSCTAAESLAMFCNPPSNPCSSHNSPTASPGSNRLLPPGQNSSILTSNATKPRGIPIITLKTREALRSPSCRDQESMEEEILQLKRALLEKDMELRRRKVYAANVEAENRKLAKDIETLERNSNLRGPRTGSPRKLRSKIAGMKVMLEEARNTCELQSIELYQLRRDVCLTHARELEVERNVYAAEVRRLQEVVKKLKLANGRTGHENRMIGRLKAKNHHLEVMNVRLSSCLSASLSQTPRTPRTLRIQPQRDALVRNSFGCFDYIQQQQENPSNNRFSTSPGACLPR